jgi:hypothetical protein
VPIPAQRRRTNAVAAAYQTERQATGGDHRPPFLRLAGQTRAQRDHAFHLGLIGYLEVEMNPRSVIADLLVYVSITIWRLEASKFWMLGPRIA